MEEGLYSVTHQTPLLVIDSQQRLTTVILLIEALARKLGDREPLDGFSASKLRHYYLLNTEERGDRRYKLILSQNDKASSTAILDQEPRPKEYSLRVEENFKLFQQWVADANDSLTAICKGLAKLIVVDISLDRGKDNPQLIFESLNSTGRELSQADLVRNFVLMGLESEMQARLYEQYWRPMEVDFGQEAYTNYFDDFMRHYLTVKMGAIPKVREVYDAFKEYARSPQAEAIEDLLADMCAFAGDYCKIALGTEEDAALREAFRDIRELKVDVAFPFLLELYHDYFTGKLPRNDLLRAVRLVESYVFRRAVCSIPTNSLNKTFATFIQALDKERYLESIKAYFLMLPSYRRFPSHEEFRRELKSRDLYNFRSRRYCLRRLENHGRKEPVVVDEYTIEHIMPQNQNLSQEWKADLGPNWARIQETYLHTLGNLTLTGYNSEYRDRPFAQKRDMEGGFARSPLHLNQELGDLTCWNEDAICSRAETLAVRAVAVWLRPDLDLPVREAYRQGTTTRKYTIDDHPKLKSGPMGELFEMFRRQVLALDPCVNEEFLKGYVAYKAETNFVNVVPQTMRLRLVLNVAFHEIDDPWGLCKDVSNLGGPGNGNVEIGLSSEEDLPYVMGLVRQALETQMGNGNA